MFYCINFIFKFFEYLEVSNLSLIFFFTLFNFVFSIFFTYKLGRYLIWVINISSTFFSLVYIIIFLKYFSLNTKTHCLSLTFSAWIHVSDFKVDWAFLFSGLSTFMCLIIILISLLVQIYSYSYLFFDPNLTRFLAYFSLFTFFMVILVTADNLLVLFFGWEGVGLCSYLLISFWNSRVHALKSALKAMFVNKIGDIFLLIAICSIFNEFGSLDFLVLWPLAPFSLNSLIFIYPFGLLKSINLICIFILIAAFGKSAQFIFHIWLPDAMEGPTPASALIHSATMVTAGVFLIIQFSFLIEYCNFILKILILMGSFTSICMSLCAFVETDIKKIIAYSTCSQLGYMFFACGFSGYNIAFFHLFNHAFFKASLFLCAGVIIHALSNEQNLNRMGSLLYLLPFTSSSLLIALLSLNAFPFTSGFYSKELILFLPYIYFDEFNVFIYWVGCVSSFFTAYYSYRLFFFIFLFENNLNKPTLLNLHRENFLVVFPIMILTILSIVSGYLFKDIFVGLGSDFFGYSFFVLPENLKSNFSEFLPLFIKNLPLFCSAIGWGLFFPPIIDFFIKYYTFSWNNYFRTEGYFNFFINYLLTKNYNFFFKYCFSFNEYFIFEFFGPGGLLKFMYLGSCCIERYHSKNLHNILCLTFFFFYLVISIFYLFG